LTSRITRQIQGGSCVGRVRNGKGPISSRVLSHVRLRARSSTYRCG